MLKQKTQVEKSDQHIQYINVLGPMACIKKLSKWLKVATEWKSG